MEIVWDVKIRKLWMHWQVAVYGVCKEYENNVDIFGI